MKKVDTVRNLVCQNKFRYLERKRRNTGLVRSSRSKENISPTRIVYNKYTGSKESQTSRVVIVERLHLDSCSRNKRKDRSPSMEEQYSKYWKSKTKDYQSQNFTLRKVNSELKDENQALKHKNYILEKKFEEMKKSIEEKFAIDQKKVEDNLKQKIQQYKQKVVNQGIFINKQQIRIKELLRQIEENKYLRSLISKFENQIQSLHENMIPESSPKRISELEEKKTQKKNPYLNRRLYQRCLEVTENLDFFDEIKEKKGFFPSWHNLAGTT